MLVARHAAVRLQAEVVREVAEGAVLLGVALGALADDVGEQAGAEAAGAVDLLALPLALERRGEGGARAVVPGEEGDGGLDGLPRLRLLGALAVPEHVGLVGEDAEGGLGDGRDRVEVLGETRRSSRTARVWISSRVRF